MKLTAQRKNGLMVSLKLVFPCSCQAHWPLEAPLAHATSTSGALDSLLSQVCRLDVLVQGIYGDLISISPDKKGKCSLMEKILAKAFHGITALLNCGTFSSSYPCVRIGDLWRARGTLDAASEDMMK